MTVHANLHLLPLMLVNNGHRAIEFIFMLKAMPTTVHPSLVKWSMKIIVINPTFICEAYDGSAFDAPMQLQHPRLLKKSKLAKTHITQNR